MEAFVKRYNWLILAALLTLGAVFLLKMAYLKFWVSSPLCVLYLAVIHTYVKARFGVRIPVLLLVLVWLSVALDGLGNLLDLYKKQFRYFQYDEFTHTAIPALTMPLVVWLLRMGLRHFDYQLPLGVVVVFALTIMFTLSGFYEVLEYWDDKYMWPEPGMRIHGAYDTPNDLQCDLLGMTVGGLLAYWALRRDPSAKKGRLNTDED